MRPLAGLAALLLLLPALASAEATIPMVITHHGRLLGANDAPAQGDRRMKFTLYDIPNALGDNQGREIWASTYTVKVDGEGSFSVLLGGSGSATPLTLDHFPASEDRYLAISVDDFPLTPRIRFGSVPFAVRAAVAENAKVAELARRAERADVADEATLALKARTIECAAGTTACLDGALVKPGTLTAAALAPGAIGSSVLGAGSVTGDAIAANAITTGHLTAGAVTAAKIDRTGLDADSVDGLSASATPAPGLLLALGTDGKFPGSVLGLTGAPFATAEHKHASEAYLRGAQLATTDARLAGMTLQNGRLRLAGGGYGAGTQDLEVTAANSPYLLPEGVNEFRNVYVRTGGVLTVPSWNGREGGRAQIRATGEVIVEGTINVAAKGFRGGIAFHRSVTNQWLPVDMEWGQGGESIDGEGSTRAPIAPNRGGGGGGGLDVCSYAGGGGGGSYGTVGTAGKGGKDMTTSTCTYGVQVTPSQPNAPQATAAGFGGSAGEVYGDATITTPLMGSGGGSAATDSDCTGGRGGHGGRGGGAVAIDAATITVKGSILVDGEKGGDRVNVANVCNYPGNNGGGGGGSGGSIRLRANRVVIDAGGKLSAKGGAAGVGNDGLTGGLGGDGRVRIESAEFSNVGTIDVAAGARSLATAADQGQGDATSGRWTSPLVTFEGAGRVRRVDLFATRGEQTWVTAELCAATDAAGAALDANCLPIAPSGAVDAPEGARFARVRVDVIDRASPRRFALSGVRLEYGP